MKALMTAFTGSSLATSRSLMMFINMNIHAHKYIYLYTYCKYISICVYVFIYIYMYIYIYRHIYLFIFVTVQNVQEHYSYTYLALSNLLTANLLTNRSQRIFIPVMSWTSQSVRPSSSNVASGKIPYEMEVSWLGLGKSTISMVHFPAMFDYRRVPPFAVIMLSTMIPKKYGWRYPIVS